MITKRFEPYGSEYDESACSNDSNVKKKNTWNILRILIILLCILLLVIVFWLFPKQTLNVSVFMGFGLYLFCYVTITLSIVFFIVYITYRIWKECCTKCYEFFVTPDE